MGVGEGEEGGEESEEGEGESGEGEESEEDGEGEGEGGGEESWEERKRRAARYMEEEAYGLREIQRYACVFKILETSIAREKV